MFSPRCLRHWGKQQNSGTILNWFLCDAFLGSQKRWCKRLFVGTSVPDFDCSASKFVLFEIGVRQELMSGFCPVSSGKLASNVGRRNKRKCPTPDQNSKVETGNENRKKRCWKRDVTYDKVSGPFKTNKLCFKRSEKRLLFLKKSKG